MSEIVAGFPFSPQQERVWWLQGSDTGTAYRAQCAVRLQGDLQPQMLEAALSSVVERHEILRTVFRSLPGMFLPLQVITASSAPSLRRIDVSNLPSPQQQARIEELFAAAGRKTFDLERDALLDLALVTRSPGEHVLLITLPALCSDKASLGQLVQEISRAYANTSEHEESPESPMQYVVVSQWLNELLEAEDAQIGKDYWREQHVSEAATAKLPFERDASGGAAAFAWQSITSTLPSALTTKLDELIERYDTTAFVFLLTCWQTLLCRLTGQTEVLVGTGFDGRSDADLAEALGLFARYLPLRSRLEETSTLIDSLMKVDDAARQAYEWQECFIREPFKPTTVASGETSYFPFCFDYEEQPDAYQARDVVFSIFKQYACIDRFDLKLSCVRRGDSLIAEFHFDTALFRQQDVERLAEQFQTLLESAVENTPASMGELNMLSRAERHEVLVKFNDTKRDYPRESCLHELFEQQAARTPENVAVVFQEQHITFAELNARANQLARHLRTLGVGAESFVAVCMERSLEMVVALLGTLKAGAAYVPIDPEYPAERQGFILQDIQAAVLLTQENLLAHLPQHEATVIRLDTERDILSRYSRDNSPRVIKADNLAYVIYTSGSTGTPKGVMISHRAICNHMLWMVENFALDETDIILQKTPFIFDASVSEFFAALLTGARLLMAEPGGHRDAAYMVELMARERVTTLQLVPSMLRVLLEEPGLVRVSSLKRVICAGEALTFELRDKFQSTLPARLYNLYGPTEASVDATSWDCGRELQRKTVPIGRPIDNTQVYVLDARLEPVPVGARGELYIGGDGLARGYLKRPALTAERFIPDPFSMESGARMYHTGDLVRFLPEKAVEFLSRADDQVKIRGFRIEPGEIEAVLNRHMLVRQAVVTVDEDDNGNKRLMAHVVPKNFYRLPNGLQIVQLNQNETDVIYKEIFEEQTYLKHGVSLADNDCVFDVGANIGLFTLYVHQQCRSPKVYAFEPVPATFDTLKTNVALYDLTVELFDCGLSRHNGTSEVTSYPQMSSMSGFHTDSLEDEQVTRAFISNQDERLSEYANELLAGRFRSETFQCQLRTLSDVIGERNIEAIDLLKIDAEKSELEILKGIREEDWQKIKQLVIEVHDLDGHLDEITSMLTRHGYRFVVEQDAYLANTGLYNIYAVHPERAYKATQHERRESSAPSLSALNVPGISNDELRAFLNERLPTHMVPSAFFKLDAMPLLPSGKIDRKALPSPDWTRPEQDEPYVAPRTSTETRLVEIWARTLGVEQVSIHDNFFELGGDSILGIQLIARANQDGFRLTLKQLFQYKTIAALSEVAVTRSTSRVEAGQGVETGTVRLTPSQHWFFEQKLADPHHFNQSALVEVQPAEPRVFEKVFEHLMLHHDALRLRFVHEENGWHQFYTSSGESVSLGWEDLSDFSEAEQQSRLESRAAELQTSLNLQDGPLMRAAVFNLGAGRPNVLLLVIHHLVVDAISWRILMEDFETAYGQLLAGRAVQFPSKTASFKQWSERLDEYAQSDEVQEGRQYWLDESRLRAAVLPLDFTEGDNTVASALNVSVSLDVEETAALLRDVPKAYNTQINDVLLVALVQAFSKWTGAASLLVDMEGHGRETISDNLDISRTVGWFTSVFPVLLELPEDGEAGEALKSVKEQLRRVPHHGLGYGLLRYLSADAEVSARLLSMPQAEVSFNYLGKFERDEAKTAILGASRETNAPVHSPRGARRYLLEINGSVSEGRLRFSWSYSANRHTAASVERLANEFIDRLRSLIDHCVNREARGYTPTDFPEAELSQKELDDLMAELSGSIGL
jgi:amino acid adenylation domain-containing protein/non-ribosomal peptide synthase protein (TIGR01720 family)/FkbM family methyltransferase